MNISSKRQNYLFYFILSIFIIILIVTADTLSISYKEALNVLNNKSILTYITYLPLHIFGFNDFALRFPFIIFYALSSILMYKITKNYFRYEFDRLINILVFMSLPGLISASLLVNTAIIVIACTLLYLYLYQKNGKHNYYLLVIFLFIDNSFAILFLALFFYSLNKRENKLLIISLLLFTLSMYIYGFNTSGKPQSHLIDTFGIYASIFSPLLFLYFFYAMYRIGVRGERTIYWYISITALSFSLLFAFRQRIYIEDFAPYVIITIPLMTKLYLHTLRVRLPQFRGFYKNVAYATLLILFINVFLTLFNKPIYLLLENPKKHFAYNYHIAKDIAKILKDNNINNVYVNSYSLGKRLSFYGIKEGDAYYISLKKLNAYDEKFDIIYYGKIVNTLYVQKR